MIDVIAPNQSSLKTGLIQATFSLKMNMSLIPNNLVDVSESMIWNTLIPPQPVLPDDIDDSNDNKNEEDDDDLLPMPVKSEESDYTC